MQRYKLNTKLLVFFLIGFAVFAGSVHLLHGFQVRRNSGSLLELAQKAKQEGDLRGAVDNYFQYLQLQPDDKQGQVDYANAITDLAESGKATFEEMSKAYARLEVTIRNVPDNDELRRRMVDFVMKYAPGRLKDAIDHLQLLLQRKPSDKELGFLYVQCLMGTREFEKTVDLCSIMIGLDRTTNEFSGEPPDPLPNTWEEAWKGLWATGTENEQIYVILASLLSGQYDNPKLADRVIDQMVAVNPESFRAYLQRASYRQRNKDQATAKADIDRALVLDPDDAGVILAAAQMAIEEKDYDAARKYVEHGIEQHADDERMYQTFASLEIAQGNTEAALAQVDRGLETIPGSFNLLHYKANLQLQEKDLDAVRQTIKIMEEQNFPAALRDFVQARLLMLDRKWIDASRELERIRPLIMATRNRDKLGPKIDVLLGQCYEKLGRNDVALSRYERAFNADPTLKNAQIGMARIHMQSGAQRAVAQSANSIQAEVNRQLSRPEAERNWQVVDRSFERVVAANKLKGVQVEVLRSQFLVMKKQFDKARQVLSQARKDYPEEPSVLLAAAKLMIDDPQGNLEKGVVILDQAEKQFGATLAIRISKAELLLRLRSDDLRPRLVALEAGVDTLSKEDQDTFWRQMGIIYHQAQLLSDARRCYQHVADANPDDLPMKVKLFDLALASDDEEAIGKAQDSILELVGTKEDSTWQYCEVSRLLRKVRLDLMQGKPRDDTVLAEAQKLVDQIMGERPNWYEAYQLQAVINTLKGQYDTAIDNFNRALELGPPNPSLAFRLVHLLYAKKRFAEAWNMMQLIPKEQRTFLPGKLVAGIGLQTGHIDEALAAAQRVVAKAPNDPEVHIWHAQVLALAKRGPELEAALREAIKLDPHRERAWIALVAHLAQTNQKEKAEEELRRAQTSLPDQRVPLVLARGSEALGKQHDAEKYYLQALGNDPNNIGMLQAVAAYYLGKNYYGSDGSAKAAPYLQQILTTAKQEPGQLNLNLIWARRETAKILAATRIYANTLQAIKALDLNAYNGKMLREDVLLKAGILASRAEPVSRRQAIALFEQLKRVEPLTTGQQLIFAQLCYRANRWPECREQMLDLLAREDATPKVLASFCGMLIQRGDIDEANRWLKNLEQIDPKSTMTVGLRARVLVKQGNSKQAVDLLTSLLPKPVQHKDKDLVLLGNIAQLLEELEQYDAAERFYRKLAELEPRAMLTLAGFLGRRGRTDEAFAAIDNIAPGEMPLLVIKVATDLIRNRRDEVGSRFDEQIQGRLDQVLRDNPNAAAPIIQMAVFRDVQQKYDEAEKLYRDLLAREDVKGRNRATIQNNLAFILAMFEKDADDAKLFVNQAIAFLGPSDELLDTRAMVSLAAGDYAAAISDLTLVVSDSEKAMYYFHLAFADLASGDKEAARTAYLKAEELGLKPEKIHPLDRKRYDQLIQALELTPAGHAA